MKNKLKSNNTGFLKLLLFLSLVFILIFQNQVFANLEENQNCEINPEKISIYSGDFFLGEYESNYFNSQSNKIFVSGDLKKKPLKIQISFKKKNQNCILNQDDVHITYFENSVDRYAQEFVETDNLSTYTFIENSLEYTNLFDVKYYFNSKQKNINLIVDSDFPEITFEITNSNDQKINEGDVVKFDEELKIDYTISDESGLSSFSINPGILNKVYQNDEKEDVGNISFKYSNQNEIVFNLVDKLGNSKKSKFMFTQYLEQETKPKILSELIPFDSKIAVTKKRVVSFELFIQKATITNSVNDNVEIININENNVIADFSDISDSHNFVKAKCKNVDGTNNKKCIWYDIPIEKLQNTKTINVKINVTDDMENSITQSFNTEIFIDSKPPEIRRFEVVNKFNKTNIFSGSQNETYLYLTIFDDSLNGKFENLRIHRDFPFGNWQDEMEFETNFKSHCDIEEDLMNCSFDISKYLEKYAYVDYGEIYFNLTVSDIFWNQQTSSLKVLYDNVKPVVTRYEIIETDDIKDKILSSEEVIDIDVFFTEKNFADGGRFNYLSLKKFGIGKHIEPFMCENVGSDNYKCRFSKVKLGFGYKKDNIESFLIDRAGNVEISNKEIEIFKKDETDNTRNFADLDLNVVGSIDKYILTRRGIDSYFEGEIKQIDDSSDIRIVNYQFISDSCNSEDIDELSFGEKSLYPNNIVYYDQEKGVGNIDKNFAIKVSLNKIDDVIKKNSTILKCKMSILKVSKDSVYTPEIIDLNLNFSFFELPNRNILNMKAKSLLEDIKRGEDMRKTVTSIQKVFDVTNTICNIGNTLIGTWSTITGILGTIETSLKLYSLEKTVEPISKVVKPTDGKWSDLNAAGKFKKFCSYITCENGGILGSFWEGKLGGSKLNYIDDINRAAEGFCTANDEGDKNEK